MRIRLLLALLAFAMPAEEGRATPGTLNAQSFELQWVLEPHTIPNGDFWVRRRGTVVETRLLPTELFVANAPVTAADGTILMGVGQQLVRLHARQSTVCNLTRGRTGRVVIRRVCLVDADNDGSYDSYFERALSTSNFLAEWTGHIPENMDRIAAPDLRTIPPAEMAGAPIIKLVFSTILDGGLTIPITLTRYGRNVVSFGFEVGTARRGVPISRNCLSHDLPSYCASATLPSQFRFAGLVLDILERRDEDIRVRVQAPFDRVTVRIADTSRDGYTTGELFLVENQ